MDMQVQDSIVITADPVDLYDQIADPSQMSRWSPENRGRRRPYAGAARHGRHHVHRHQ